MQFRAKINMLSPRNKLAPWKVAGNNKDICKEQTLHSFRLPEKFSPSKMEPNGSRLFNPSIQKIKTCWQNEPKEVHLMKKKEEGNCMRLQGHFMEKQSIDLQRLSPPKQTKRSKITILSKDSCASAYSEQVNLIKQQNLKDRMHQYDQNRKILLELKEEFHSFKVLVISQINNQRNMMFQMIEEISKKLTANFNLNHSLQSRIVIDISEFEKSMTFLADQLNNNENNIILTEENIQWTPLFDKKDQILQRNGGIQDGSQPKSTESPLSQKNDQIFSKQTLVQDPHQLKPKQINQERIQMPIEVPTDHILEEKIPSLSLQAIFNQKQSNKPINKKQHKGSPNLLKCNHIVETINALNEINDSPVEVCSIAKPKQVQKQAIQSFKHKFLAFSKDNQLQHNYTERYTQRQPGNFNLLDKQLMKVKSNSKLDKFYNTIEKLKLQVNEIKHKNNFKHPNTERIFIEDQ